MAGVAIFYGSSTGTTAQAAERIAAAFGSRVGAVYNIADVDAAFVDRFDLLVLGVPSFGSEELHHNWEAFEGYVDRLELLGKTVALFGLGDQRGYPHRFVDGMGLLHDLVVDRGALVVGRWSTRGYTFKSSKAVAADRFVGLALDEDTQPELSERRIQAWVEQVKAELLQATLEP